MSDIPVETLEGHRGEAKAYIRTLIAVAVVGGFMVAPDATATLLGYGAAYALTGLGFLLPTLVAHWRDVDEKALLIVFGLNVTVWPLALTLALFLPTKETAQ